MCGRPKYDKSHEKKRKLYSGSKRDTIILPWVAGLLGSAPLQLFHQHLAAPPQSITNLPERATAAQRPVTILREEEKQVSICTAESSIKCCDPNDPVLNMR